MNLDVIKFLEKSINEKTIPHAFLIETKNSEKLIDEIYEKLFSMNLITISKKENNASTIIIEPENNIIDKNKILDLQERFKTTTFDNSYKLYFIKNSEQMNSSSNNKLLKFLEEPDSNIIGFLFTNDINLNLETIKSRCEVFKMKDIGQINDDLLSEAEKLFEYNHKPICDIMIYVSCLKKFERSELIQIIDLLCNLLLKKTENIACQAEKINNIKNLNNLINSNVNIDLILDRLSIELGK